MGLIIGSNFYYRGVKFLDERQGLADGLEDLRAWNTACPEGFEVFVKSEKSWYTYDSDIDDIETGKFKLRSKEIIDDLSNLELRVEKNETDIERVDSEIDDLTIVTNEHKDSIDDLSAKLEQLGQDLGTTLTAITLETQAELLDKNSFFDREGFFLLRKGISVVVYGDPDTYKNGTYYFNGNPDTSKLSMTNWIKSIDDNDMVGLDEEYGDKKVLSIPRLNKDYVDKVSNQNITAEHWNLEGDLDIGDVETPDSGSSGIKMAKDGPTHTMKFIQGTEERLVVGLNKKAESLIRIGTSDRGLWPNEMDNIEWVEDPVTGIIKQTSKVLEPGDLYYDEYLFMKVYYPDYILPDEKETVKISLLTHIRELQDNLLGTEVVLYIDGEVIETKTWQGTMLEFEVVEGKQYEISYGQVDGFQTPQNYVKHSEGSYTTSLIVYYNTQLTNVEVVSSNPNDPNFEGLKGDIEITVNYYDESDNHLGTEVFKGGITNLLIPSNYHFDFTFSDLYGYIKPGKSERWEASIEKMDYVFEYRSTSENVFIQLSTSDNDPVENLNLNNVGLVVRDLDSGTVIFQDRYINFPLSSGVFIQEGHRYEIGTFSGNIGSSVANDILGGYRTPSNVTYTATEYGVNNVILQYSCQVTELTVEFEDDDIRDFVISVKDSSGNNITTLSIDPEITSSPVEFKIPTGQVYKYVATPIEDFNMPDSNLLTAKTSTNAVKQVVVFSKKRYYANITVTPDYILPGEVNPSYVVKYKEFFANEDPSVVVRPWINWTGSELVKGRSYLFYAVSDDIRFNDSLESSLISGFDSNVNVGLKLLRKKRSTSVNIIGQPESVSFELYNIQPTPPTQSNSPLSFIPYFDVNYEIVGRNITASSDYQEFSQTCRYIYDRFNNNNTATLIFDSKFAEKNLSYTTDYGTLNGSTVTYFVNNVRVVGNSYTFQHDQLYDIYATTTDGKYETKSTTILNYSGGSSELPEPVVFTRKTKTVSVTTIPTGQGFTISGAGISSGESRVSPFQAYYGETYVITGDPLEGYTTPIVSYDCSASSSNTVVLNYEALTRRISIYSGYGITSGNDVTSVIPTFPYPHFSLYEKSSSGNEILIGTSEIDESGEYFKRTALEIDLKIGTSYRIDRLDIDVPLYRGVQCFELDRAANPLSFIVSDSTNSPYYVGYPLNTQQLRIFSSTPEVKVTKVDVGSSTRYDDNGDGIIGTHILWFGNNETIKVYPDDEENYDIVTSVYIVGSLDTTNPQPYPVNFSSSISEVTLITKSDDGENYGGAASFRITSQDGSTTYESSVNSDPRQSIIKEDLSIGSVWNIEYNDMFYTNNGILSYTKPSITQFTVTSGLNYKELVYERIYQSVTVVSNTSGVGIGEVRRKYSETNISTISNPFTAEFGQDYDLIIVPSNSSFENVEVSYTSGAPGWRDSSVNLPVNFDSSTRNFKLTVTTDGENTEQIPEVRMTNKSNPGEVYYGIEGSNGSVVIEKTLNAGSVWDLYFGDLTINEIVSYNKPSLSSITVSATESNQKTVSYSRITQEVTVTSTNPGTDVVGEVREGSTVLGNPFTAKFGKIYSLSVYSESGESGVVNISYKSGDPGTNRDDPTETLYVTFNKNTKTITINSGTSGVGVGSYSIDDGSIVSGNQFSIAEGSNPVITVYPNNSNYNKTTHIFSNEDYNRGYFNVTFERKTQTVTIVSDESPTVDVGSVSGDISTITFVATFGETYDFVAVPDNNDYLNGSFSYTGGEIIGNDVTYYVTFEKLMIYILPNMGLGSDGGPAWINVTSNSNWVYEFSETVDWIRVTSVESDRINFEFDSSIKGSGSRSVSLIVSIDGNSSISDTCFITQVSEALDVFDVVVTIEANGATITPSSVISTGLNKISQLDNVFNYRSTEGTLYSLRLSDINGYSESEPIQDVLPVKSDFYTMIYTPFQHITLTPSSVALNYVEGDSRSVFLSGPSDWSIDLSTVPSWLRVVKNSETSVVIYSESENTGTENREVDVLIQAEGYLDSYIRVVQFYKNP